MLMFRSVKARGNWCIYDQKRNQVLFLHMQFKVIGFRFAEIHQFIHELQQPVGIVP